MCVFSPSRPSCPARSCCLRPGKIKLAALPYRAWLPSSLLLVGASMIMPVRFSGSSEPWTSPLGRQTDSLYAHSNAAGSIAAWFFGPGLLKNASTLR